MMKRTVLVVAPHADDETFGCGGTILRHLAEGDRVHIVVVSAGDILFEHLGDVVPRKTREAEFRRVVEMMGPGCTGELLPFTEESRLDTLPRVRIVKEIERANDSIAPDIWYIPGPSFHQDHRVCFEACLSALRPTRAMLPREVYRYELPTYSWNPREWAHRGNMYVDIASYLEQKLLLISLYESQVRALQSMLSIEKTRQWACFRGAEAKAAAAECFEIVRVIR